jgi:short-subunit dehydrogenase
MMVCPWFVDTHIGDHALGPDGAPAPLRARTGVRALASPEQVADAIVRAAPRDRRLLLVPGRARLAYLVSRLAPRVYERLMLRQLTRGR